MSCFISESLQKFIFSPGLIERTGDAIHKYIRHSDSEYIGSLCLEDPLARQNLIEPRIRSLVLSMNHTGHIKTLASCQGHIAHFPWPCMSINQPFIYFKADPQIYKAIYSRLQYFGARVRMRHGYVALGLRMHPSEGVCMHIDLGYGKRWIRRRQVDEDIALLSEILDQDIFQKLPDSIGQKVVNDDRGNREKK